MEFQITAVERDRAFEHEGISAIGNNKDGWSVSARGAIVRIDKDLAKFFVEDALTGERAYIAVVREEGKPPYLRSFLNGRWGNHLLPLPSLKNCNPID